MQNEIANFMETCVGERSTRINSLRSMFILLVFLCRCRLCINLVFASIVEVLDRLQAPGG